MTEKMIFLILGNQKLLEFFNINITIEFCVMNTGFLL